MEKEVRARLTSGIVIILLGLGLWGMQYMGDTGDSVALVLLGGLCIAGYLNTRSRFLLIVGCLVFGLGVGSFGERTWMIVGEFTKIGLGIGFVLIYLISLLWERKAHWWPLIPGLVLLLLGFQAWRSFRIFMQTGGWPLILVGVGVLMVLGAFGKGRKKPANPSE